MRSDVAYISVLCLSLVPALYVAGVLGRRRHWSKTQTVRRVLAGAGTVALLLLMHLAILHRLTFPSKITFPVRSQQLSVAGQRESGFYLFNPSVARYGGSLVVAVREGNLNNCPEFSSWFDLRRFARVDSRVLITRASGAEDLSRPLRVERTLTNDDEKVFYHGVDDPRLIVGSDGRLYATVAQNNRLFVSSFDESLKETARNKVLPQWPGATPKQKNWMYVPSPAAHEHSLLFAQWLNPLSLAELDPATGLATIAFNSNTTIPLPAGLRGSTNFLPHPTIPNRFFAIAHEKEELYPPIIISFFRSRVVEIERKANGEWAVTGVSEQFSLPSGEEKGRVHRIHYPTSLVYEKEGDTSSLLIGMGFMDCSAHVVKVDTHDFLAMVKPVSELPRPVVENRN